MFREAASFVLHLFILSCDIYLQGPIRDKSSKWYVSKEEYPDDVFPNYLGGKSPTVVSTLPLLVSLILR